MVEEKKKYFKDVREVTREDIRVETSWSDSKITSFIKRYKLESIGVKDRKALYNANSVRSAVEEEIKRIEEERKFILRPEDMTEEDRISFEQNLLSSEYLRRLSDAIGDQRTDYNVNAEGVLTGRGKNRYEDGVGVKSASLSKGYEKTVVMDEILRDFSEAELKRMGVLELSVKDSFFEPLVVKERIDEVIKKFDLFIKRGKYKITEKSAERIVDKFIKSGKVKYSRAREILMFYVGGKLTEEVKGEEARKRLSEYSILTPKAPALKITPADERKEEIEKTVEEIIKGISPPSFDLKRKS